MNLVRVGSNLDRHIRLVYELHRITTCCTKSESFRFSKLAGNTSGRVGSLTPGMATIGIGQLPRAASEVVEEKPKGSRQPWPKNTQKPRDLAGLEPAIVSDMLHNMLREMMGSEMVPGRHSDAPFLWQFEIVVHFCRMG